MTNFIVLDTETTGLGSDAEIVEIAIIDAHGNALLNTLVKPSNPIPDDVIAIHGITNQMVIDAPVWADIVDQVKMVLYNYRTWAYNAQFDMRMMLQNGWTGNIPAMDCVMKKYVDKFGIGYPHYSLKKAANDCQITFNDLTPHRAASDCAVTLDVLRAIYGLKPIATGAFAKQYHPIYNKKENK